MNKQTKPTVVTVAEAAKTLAALEQKREQHRERGVELEAERKRRSYGRARAVRSRSKKALDAALAEEVIE